MSPWNYCQREENKCELCGTQTNVRSRDSEMRAFSIKYVDFYCDECNDNRYELCLLCNIKKLKGSVCYTDNCLRKYKFERQDWIEKKCPFQHSNIFYKKCFNKGDLIFGARRYNNTWRVWVFIYDGSSIEQDWDFLEEHGKFVKHNIVFTKLDEIKNTIENKYLELIH